MPPRFGFLADPEPAAALRFPEAQGANQSPPLKPAKPENAEQTSGNGCGFRNDCAPYLDVIQLELKIVAIGLPTRETYSQDEIVDVESRSGRDGETYDLPRGGREHGGSDGGKSKSGIGAELKRSKDVAVSGRSVCKANRGHVIDPLR